ncbi:hypothetical protein T01_3274 [Trichinella spiralis]|uniref:Uncharacterized protein n=1 Tax=Trichinella spiralis TaxID=6334 RepID=A0A0V1BPP3_TRISP|nr:hypothetical protein T01_3274 [Trichinella spiralis]
MKRSTVFTVLQWCNRKKLYELEEYEIEFRINLLFIQCQTIFKAWIIFMLNSVTVKKMDELAQNSVEKLNLYTFHIFQNFQAK